MFQQFISEYGTILLYTIVSALFGYLGIVAKRLYEKYVNTKEKQKVAEDVVRFTEQVYKDLHGEEKLNKALEAAAEILAGKGIQCSELELRVLIESALASFNEVFQKNQSEDDLPLPEIEYVDDFRGEVEVDAENATTEEEPE